MEIYVNTLHDIHFDTYSIDYEIRFDVALCLGASFITMDYL